MSSYAFEISTAAKEPVLFTVDGKEYEILGFERQSKGVEAHLTALFARHSRLQERLAKAKPEVAEKIGESLYDIRIEILTSLTTVPRDIVETIPRSGQIQLMNAIAKESGVTADDDAEAATEDDDLS
jgi:hypothetical protein